MNRTLLIVAGMFGASGPVLMDSAVKGTALLVVAAIAALTLRRDSAATRHLVWLLAMAAMLVVPVLSAMLPRWRVLPEWVRIPPARAVVSTGPPAMARPADGAMERARPAVPEDVASPSATAYQPAVRPPDSRPASATPAAIPASAAASWSWLDALTLVWALGSCVLILRLLASRWMLGKTERQGTVIGSSGQPSPIHRRFANALEAACSQLRIGRPVTLLIHPDRTIPLVWGILRYRLMLPAAAGHWGDEQLRSVLLHELAHIKRRDTMARLLAQIACALHWFNPLVWLAAWRLGVECERACDDLVLANGVRPSAYAGHLLDVVTGFSPAGWAHSGGLAMARKSSLERRLVAVLSDKLNRRGVSVALAAIALALAAGIAVPIAMLRAADDEPGGARAAAGIAGPPADAPRDRQPLGRDRRAAHLRGRGAQHRADQGAQRTVPPGLELLLGLQVHDALDRQLAGHQCRGPGDQGGGAGRPGRRRGPGVRAGPIQCLCPQRPPRQLPDAEATEDAGRGGPAGGGPDDARRPSSFGAGGLGGYAAGGHPARPHPSRRRPERARWRHQVRAHQRAW